MTAFVLICAAMLVAVLAWVTLPLWRSKAMVNAEDTRGERRISGAVLVVAMVAAAAGLYATLSNWDWNAAESQAAEQAQVDSMLAQLEAKLAANPQDVQGWMMLGRSYATLQRYARAVDAYQRAYDLTGGESVEATIGLAEALALVDQASLNGRAGELIEAALARAPSNPKALWYGSVMALQAGDLRLGRDRLSALLAQNPPEELRGILERQIQDLTAQLGEAGEGSPSASDSPAAAAEQKRVIRASISIAPSVQQQLKGPTPLFVLARDPATGGPPLAVQRRVSTEAPFTVELSAADAMMPSRTLASASQVKVVARLSLSGAPQERSGDFYGEADYDFNKDTGTVQIVIDRTVP